MVPVRAFRRGLDGLFESSVPPTNSGRRGFGCTLRGRERRASVIPDTGLQSVRENPQDSTGDPACRRDRPNAFFGLRGVHYRARPACQPAFRGFPPLFGRFEEVEAAGPARAFEGRGRNGPSKVPAG